MQRVIKYRQEPHEIIFMMSHCRLGSDFEDVAAGKTRALAITATSVEACGAAGAGLIDNSSAVNRAAGV